MLLKEARQQNEQLLEGSSGAFRIKDLESENTGLLDRVAKLEEKLKSLKSRNANLVSKNKELKKLSLLRKKELSSLRADVEVAHSCWRELKNKLDKTEKKRFLWAECARRLERELSDAKTEIGRLKVLLNRNSENSSLPPSLDPNRKVVHNLRVPTGRRPGGQPGHAGHRRHVMAPDEYVRIKPPLACPDCGGKLKVLAPTHRQITELVITTKTTDYAASRCVCKKCGHSIPAQFPSDAQNESNYGNNVRAISTFLTTRCNVSKNNVARFIFEATKGRLVISTGSIQNFLKDFETRAKGEIADIITSLKAAPVIASDATHTRSGGQSSYIYTFNTSKEALFLASDKKGMAPLEASPLASYKGTVVHDHDRSYYNFGSRHGECNVHILRYLKGVIENEPERSWAPLMRTLLCEANDAAKNARTQGLDSLPATDITAFKARYDAIVTLGTGEYAAIKPIHCKYRPEGMALCARLGNYRESHLAFIQDFRIPFDNNASERLLRKAKGKLKQSGGFRSTENGQAHYCTYLSIIETALLRDKKPLEVVQSIFEGKSGVLKKQMGSPSACDP